MRVIPNGSMTRTIRARLSASQTPPRVPTGNSARCTADSGMRCARVPDGGADPINRKAALSCGVGSHVDEATTSRIRSKAGVTVRPVPPGRGRTRKAPARGSAPGPRPPGADRRPMPPAGSGGRVRRVPRAGVRRRTPLPAIRSRA